MRKSPFRSSSGYVLAVAAVMFTGAFSVSAMDIAADYHVPFTPENAILGYFSPTKKPTITVPSGAIVAIDGGGGVRLARPSTPAPADGAPAAAPSPASPTAEAVNTFLKDNHIDTTVETCPALAETIDVMKNATYRPKGGRGGHLLNGPVYVEGAEPGDTLEIRILNVTPRIPYGVCGGGPGTGALATTGEIPRQFMHVIPIDLKRNAGVFDKNVEVPLAPFMGVMGNCPADSEGAERSSGPPGNFGGNLDCKYLCAGSTLYLPVFQKGALFYTGDSHAAQGDGEITVNAIETANTCVLQFIVHKGMALKMPRAENATHYLLFGLDPDLNKAMHQAIMETMGFLQEKQGYDIFDAYALSSIGVDFHVTQDVNKTNGIHSMVPKRLFINDTNKYWYHPN